MLGRIIIGLVLLITPAVGWGQSTDLLTSLLSSAPLHEPEAALRKIDEFKAKLHIKRDRLKNDEAFLQYTFRETHRTFLHNYKAYSQFPEIVESGNYDCLSATGFFSILLDEFGFSYKIIETNYHIFLMVETSQRQILIESTDELNGFVTDQKLINERLKAYRANSNNLTLGVSARNKYYYQYDLDLYQEVKPNQLTGLFFYNQAVSAYNAKDLVACAENLKKAIRIYNSPRIAEFAVILVNSIADSEMSVAEKKRLIGPFAQLIKARADLVASR